MKIKKAKKPNFTPIHQEPILYTNYEYGVVAPINDEIISNEEQVIRYFTAMYGEHPSKSGTGPKLTLVTVLSDDFVLSNFCEFNKIDKTDAIAYIRKYLTSY